MIPHSSLKREAGELTAILVTSAKTLKQRTEKSFIIHHSSLIIPR